MFHYPILLQLALIWEHMGCFSLDSETDEGRSEEYSVRSLISWFFPWRDSLLYIENFYRLYLPLP